MPARHSPFDFLTPFVSSHCSAVISFTLASLIRSSFRLCRFSPRRTLAHSSSSSSCFSSSPLSLLSSSSFSSSSLTPRVRTYSSHSLLRIMSAYTTRVIGAPNTLEHRVYIGNCIYSFLVFTFIYLHSLFYTRDQPDH